MAAAGVDLRRIDEAIGVILAEFAEISKKPVGEPELKKAKEYIKGRVILAWEDSRTAAFSYGTDEILEGRMRSLDEYLRKIEAVESEDVLRVAKFLIDNSKLNLAVVGPFKNTASFEKILKI